VKRGATIRRSLHTVANMIIFGCLSSLSYQDTKTWAAVVLLALAAYINGFYDGKAD